jgi:glycosyltransferase involved in cell wall biosynthesis
MKIAQIASLAERVPPKKYGGTERVIHALTEELVRRGHDVTLFASGDSVTSARLVSVYPQALRESGIIDPYGKEERLFQNIGVAYARAEEFDVIHDHTAPFGVPTANITPVPVAMTMHGPITEANQALFESLTRPHLVTISNAQREPAPHLNYIGTVYNGLPLEGCPFSASDDGYLLFVGRISMEKGVHHAIEVVRLLKRRLIIAAKIDNVDRAYFKEYIEPHISDDIQLVGEVDEPTRNKLMSRASCFLHPVTWPEPFGLTLIEAMACGTPVVAFRKGSIPEIIVHEKTGFVVDTVAEMAEAIQNIERIDRAACRRRALENFNVERMTDGYEEVYRKMLGK